MKVHLRYSAAIVAALVLVVPAALWAQDASSTTPDIQSQIDQQNAQIAQLNTQIAQYQTQLNATDAKKQTLQNTLSQITLSLKKTSTSINLSQAQISATELQILQLAAAINVKQASIQSDQAALGESLRTLDQSESQPLGLQLLSDDNVSAAWNDLDEESSLRDAFNGQLTSLQAAQKQLADTQAAQVTKQQLLQQHQQQLKTQQGSLAATKQTQSDLLSQTKAQEATYQSIIAQKKAQEASFESELTNLIASANQTVSQGEITAAVPGTLQWPIAGAITISQFFGNTAYANAHEALYSGHGHDGLDITARIGTPVHAALSGSIIGTGNTDATPGCKGGSFGKWVMIQHNNGLNTMYAHLSQIDVTQGQKVVTGDVIGYSGETGYATGPHLHFGVYVSAVTQIVPLGQITKGSSPCSKAIMPVPPVSGYLNPLNYLPATPYKTL
jgi:murein DD-endopeptidase MepM/ murein hydrolase activator NlpD